MQFKICSKKKKLLVIYARSITGNVLQLYLVADFENENFKLRKNEHRNRKLE